MTPKEKSKELVIKFLNHSWISYEEGFEVSSNMESAKQCALIAAKEVLNEIPYINNTDDEITKRVFWIYTIEEINKL
jgi:hypothetical protein